MYPKHFLDYFREFETTDEVFVAMPFGGDAAERRWDEIFVPAIEEVDLKPYRVDARDVGDSILTDILEGIGRARLVLGDVSDEGVTVVDESGVRRPNPNAVYELGIAHAARLETEVVVVREEPEHAEEERVPFDLLHIRHHTFDPGDPEEAVGFISGLLEDALREVDRTRDRIVERILPRLDEDSIDLILDHYESGSFDPWNIPPPESKGYARTYRWAVIPRLLDMGVLRAERHPSFGWTRYNFTELGELLGDLLPDRAGIVPEDPDE